MLDVDIFGCCVSRDIISFNKHDFNVLNYYEGISLISQFQNRVTPFFSLEDLNNILNSKNITLRNSKKKWLLADLNGDVFDRLNNSQAKWLIFDIRPLFYELYRITTESGIQYVTYWDYEIKYDLISAKIPIIKAEYLDRNHDFNYAQYLLKFIQIIKQRYGNNIIFIDVLEARHLLNHAGNVIPMGFDSKLFLDEQKWTAFILENLDCYYLPCPSDILADECHWWGVSSVHYVSEYYDYGYECLCKICSNYSNITHFINTSFSKIRLFCTKLIDKIDYSFRNVICSDLNEQGVNQIIPLESRIRLLSGETLYTFATYCEQGHRIIQNHSISLLLFSLAFEKGCKNSAYRAFDIGFANCLPLQESIIGSLKTWSTQNDVVAIFDIATAYSEGYMVNVDRVRAIELYRSILNTSDSAVISLFNIQFSSKHLDKVLINRILELADKSNEYAIIALSKMLATGVGIKKNYDAAINLLIPLSDKKNFSAIILLFDLYYTDGNIQALSGLCKSFFTDSVISSNPFIRIRVALLKYRGIYYTRDLIGAKGILDTLTYIDTSCPDYNILRHDLVLSSQIRRI